MQNYKVPCIRQRQIYLGKRYKLYKFEEVERYIYFYL